MKNKKVLYKKYSNGKEEYFNTDKQLVYRKRINEEEIWERDNTGKCIKYTRYVYFN